MVPSSAEWLRVLQQRAWARRIPLSGVMELTRRCNLRCVHCYLGSQEEQWARRPEELSTARLIEIIIETGDEIAEPFYGRIANEQRALERVRALR